MTHQRGNPELRAQGSSRAAGAAGAGGGLPGSPWAGIVGQEAAVALLRRAVATDRVPHAYAFVGPAGVGRRLTATALAQAILCSEAGCGACAACRRIQAGRHPDCQLLLPSPPADNPRGVPTLRIQQIRELEHWAALAPLEGPRKVFILDEAERMTLPTAQALLKTLEEPPPRTHLILILANPRALPATVLSRCQQVRFRPLALEETVRLLVARGEDAAAAGVLARLCRGQLGLALAAELDDVRARRTAALELLTVAPALLGPRLDELAPDRISVAAYLETYWLWYRDALCLAAGADPELLVNGDRREDVGALAGRTSSGALIAAVGAIREAWLALEGNLNPRLALEHTLLTLGSRAA